jgi:hypothetical protein
MTLEEYKNWLDSPNTERVLLVVLEAYDNIQKEILHFYISSRPFYTSPNDLLPNVQFESRLIGDFYIEKSIPFFDKGIGEDNYGNLEIDNSDHALQNWQTYQFYKRKLKILLGDPVWNYNDFLISPFLGKIQRLNFSNNKIQIDFMDYLGKLDKPFQKNLIISGEHESTPQPKLYGTVYNVSPININPDLHIYQLHDNTSNVEIGKVYDRGLETTDYTTNGTGEITLNYRPIGLITCDATNSETLTINQILKQILLHTFEESELNLESFNDLGNIKPFLLGIYQTNEINTLDVCELILKSCSCYLILDQNNQITIGSIKKPESEDYIAATLGGNEIALENFEIKALNLIRWQTRLLYKKNYTLQKESDLAGAITDPNYPNTQRIEFLKQEYRTIQVGDPSILPPEGEEFIADFKPEKTLIIEKEDAETEAFFRNDILKTQRFLCHFTAFNLPYGLLCGDIIKVVDKEYNLSTNMQILKIRFFPLLGKSEIEAFF